MKNRSKLITICATAIMTITALTTFAQEDKKASQARKDVAKAEKSMANAKESLREARIDSAADYQQFKTEAELKINENKAKIAKLKKARSNDTKEVKEKYDRQLLALEVRNNDLRKKIKTSDKTKTDNWTSFKREFNHDVNELGQAFMDLTKDNTK